MIPALAQAALDHDIKGRTVQVYIHLCGQLDVCQFRRLKLTAAARAMGFDLALLSRAVTTLEARGYLESQQDPDDDRRRLFRLVYSLSCDTRTRAA